MWISIPILVEDKSKLKLERKINSHRQTKINQIRIQITLVFFLFLVRTKIRKFSREMSELFLKWRRENLLNSKRVDCVCWRAALLDLSLIAYYEIRLQGFIILRLWHTRDKLLDCNNHNVNYKPQIYYSSTLSLQYTLCK